MDNYEAILKMSREQLEVFLDNVYCTGLNNGMYFSRQPEGQANELLDENPFDITWLKKDAECATLCTECDDGDEYLLEALVESVVRNAGIDGQADENATVVLRSGKKD